MKKIKAIHQVTQNKYLNYYTYDAVDRLGHSLEYAVASRAKRIEDLKVNGELTRADAVAIFAVHEDRLVLIRQYRYPIDAYMIELPAGLIDEGETLLEAGIRELKEETGLLFTPKELPDYVNKAYFLSVGMSDESIGTIYGYASGESNVIGLEDSEDIEVIFADREMCKELLRNENVAMNTAQAMLHFINSKKGHEFSFLIY